MELRPYQKDLVLKIHEALKNNQGVLCQSPCRSGKSYIMRFIIEHTDGKCLVLAHRRELVKQLKADLGEQENLRVVSIFTEVKHLDATYEFPKLILIDEAHLSEASTYKKIVEYYGCKVIGFTATPTRLSGERLSLFDVLVTGITEKELTEQGNLSPYKYYAPDIGIDTADVTVQRGDYNLKELDSIVNKPAVYGDVVKYYKMLANGKKAICYCANIKQSQNIAEQFSNSGISAKHIDGTTSKKVRDTVMEEFKHGDLTVLCNVGLISEGITVPDCECCLLVRPTESLALYIQQSMRCLTPKEGKVAVIIDYVGNFQRHGLPTMHREWSLNGAKKIRRVNDDGSFTIRQCPSCFKVFKTANFCPYCGYQYEIKGRELSMVLDAKLKEVKEAEAKKLEEEKKAKRMEVGRCQTKQDLIKIAKERGYKPAWVWKQCQIKGIH